jgi:hypothetical protein
LLKVGVVVDLKLRMMQPAQIRQFRPYQGPIHWPRQDALLAFQQRHSATTEIEGRPRQRQWLQVVDASVFKYTDIHGTFSSIPSLSRKRLTPR